MKKILIAAILAGSLNVLVHGEDKKGPFGGYLQMPGTFHTEVVPDKRDKSFHIFLTDLEFKNPTVKDSSLDVTYENEGQKPVKFKCEVMSGNHFHCIPGKDYPNDKGTLVLNANRMKQKGTAKYPLPLRLPGEQIDKKGKSAPTGHEHH